MGAILPAIADNDKNLLSLQIQDCSELVYVSGILDVTSVRWGVSRPKCSADDICNIERDDIVSISRHKNQLSKFCAVTSFVGFFSSSNCIDISGQLCYGDERRLISVFSRRQAEIVCIQQYRQTI